MAEGFKVLRESINNQERRTDNTKRLVGVEGEGKGQLSPSWQN